MVIENVGGAGGTLGSARVAAARPDGYTLLAGSMGSHVAAPVLTPNVKYDSARDFEPVGLTANAPAVIVARKDFPAENLSEFVAYLKENGDKLKQAHGGIGASSHMACLLFNQALGIRPTSVAYRGTGPAMNDLVGGHVDFLCEQSVSVAEQIKAGTVKGYVVSANQRLATLPDIPSAKEGPAFSPLRAHLKKSSPSLPPRWTRRLMTPRSESGSPSWGDPFRPSRREHP
jgi:tripartite-type tricarboxylate transporter receptor subunit TctC